MSASDRLGFGGLLALTLLACTVDTHQRCDADPAGCPTGFYCDGEWCFPNGGGPGRDARGLPADGAVDAMRDAIVDRDAAVDGSRLDMTMDGAVDPDQMLADFIGAVDPRDGVVSGAVMGRDTIRVAIMNAPSAEYALVEPDVPCSGWVDAPVIDGVLVVGAAAWSDFGTEARFDLCVRAGADVRTFAMRIDEVAPTLEWLDLQGGLQLQASEALSDVIVGQPGCQGGREVVIDPDDPTRATAGDALDDVLGFMLVDRIGNATPCLNLTLVRHACAIASDLVGGISPVALDPSRVAMLTCTQTRFKDGQLDGTCADCAVLTRADDSDDYVYISISARRPRLAVPEIFATRPGLPEPRDTLHDLALLSANSMLLSDGDRLQFWRRAGGSWRPSTTNREYAGTIVAPIRFADNSERFAIGNSSGVTGFGVFNNEFRLVDDEHVETPSALRRLVSLSDGGNTYELASLSDDGVARVHRRIETWESSDLRQGVVELERLGLGGVVLATSELQVLLLEEQGEGSGDLLERTVVEMGGRIGCLATGDWTGDGVDDIAVCVENTLLVLPVNRQEDVSFGDPVTIVTRDVALTDVVLGDGDADGVVDALVRDASGALALIVNAPGAPVHALDPPHRVAGLRGLNPPNAALDVGLLRADNRSVSRWFSPPVSVAAASTSVTLGADEVVVGVGDLDCDQRAEVVVRDTVERTFRVLRTNGAIDPVALLPPVMLRADAVALADLNGDGWLDLVAWEANELSRWLALPAPQLGRSGQPIQMEGPVEAIKAGDWSNIGRADLVLRTGTTLTHLHRAPGETVALTPRASADFGGLLGFAIGNLDDTPDYELFVGRRTTQNALALDQFRLNGVRGGVPMAGLVRTVVAPIGGELRVFTLQHSEARDMDVIRVGRVEVMVGHLHDFVVGDFDMDGRHEVVVLAETADGMRQLHTLQIDADGEYIADPSPAPVAAEVIGVRAGDLDGDGRLDLIRVTL